MPSRRRREWAQGHGVEASLAAVLASWGLKPGGVWLGPAEVAEARRRREAEEARRWREEDEKLRRLWAEDEALRDEAQRRQVVEQTRMWQEEDGWLRRLWAEAGEKAEREMRWQELARELQEKVDQHTSCKNTWNPQEVQG